MADSSRYCTGRDSGPTWNQNDVVLPVSGFSSRAQPEVHRGVGTGLEATNGLATDTAVVIIDHQRNQSPVQPNRNRDDDADFVEEVNIEEKIILFAASIVLFVRVFVFFCVGLLILSESFLTLYLEIATPIFLVIWVISVVIFWRKHKAAFAEERARRQHQDTASQPPDPVGLNDKGWSQLARTEVSLNEDSSCNVDHTEGSCPICTCSFEIKEQIYITPCSHTFHVTCLDPWLHKSSKCPICIRDLNELLVPSTSSVSAVDLQQESKTPASEQSVLHSTFCPA